jgi:hypothetical protein
LFYCSEVLVKKLIGEVGEGRIERQMEKVWRERNGPPMPADAADPVRASLKIF